MKASFLMVVLSTPIFIMIATGCTNNSSPAPLRTDQAVENTDISPSHILAEKAESKNVINNEKYAKFFTYPYQHGAEIEPAMGGILVIKDECMLIQNGDRFNVPVFPHGITTWNESTQILTANGVDIPLNTELFTNGPLDGGKYDPEYDYDFEQQADPKCLEDRYIQFLGSQFMDVKDLPNH
ncbi:hypothetical protein [Psychrobacter sp. 16-MNA-CIBAN-0192]|uniref:hypothetical protein n=1 Tax=Psychrobacter sp. 16-MNA-CIBAN-0192 TaxID=3140448 RepID=UPI0033304967